MIFQRRVGHFKPGFLSSQGSKLDNLSAHKIENFLNFSKLVQLLSVDQFLRHLGPFKTPPPLKKFCFRSPLKLSFYLLLSHMYWEDNYSLKSSLLSSLKSSLKSSFFTPSVRQPGQWHWFNPLNAFSQAARAVINNETFKCHSQPIISTRRYSNVVRFSLVYILLLFGSDRSPRRGDLVCACVRDIIQKSIENGL